MIDVLEKIEEMTKSEIESFIETMSNKNEELIIECLIWLSDNKICLTRDFTLDTITVTTDENTKLFAKKFGYLMFTEKYKKYKKYKKQKIDEEDYKKLHEDIGWELPLGDPRRKK